MKREIYKTNNKGYNNNNLFTKPPKGMGSPLLRKGQNLWWIKLNTQLLFFMFMCSWTSDTKYINYSPFHKIKTMYRRKEEEKRINDRVCRENKYLMMCDMQIPPYLQSRTSSLVQLIFLHSCFTIPGGVPLPYSIRCMFGTSESPHAQSYKFENNSYP